MQLQVAVAAEMYVAEMQKCRNEAAKQKHINAEIHQCINAE
jgi:hypothetical protein